ELFFDLLEGVLEFPVVCLVRHVFPSLAGAPVHAFVADVLVHRMRCDGHSDFLFSNRWLAQSVPTLPRVERISQVTVCEYNGLWESQKGSRGKSEARKPKSEARNPKKPESRFQPDFGFRISDFYPSPRRHRPICRTACRRRCSFSTSASRRYPSP